MALTNVWLRTVADGLIRADQVVGIVVHRTPAIAGKPSRWLLDIVLPVGTGSGAGDNWISGPLHRTLAQTDPEPARAPEALARLLAKLDTVSAAGTIVVQTVSVPAAASGAVEEIVELDDSPIRLRFIPFAPTEPARHYDSQYDSEYI